MTMHNRRAPTTEQIAVALAVLGLSPPGLGDNIEMWKKTTLNLAWKAKARTVHPDRGGRHVDMAEVNAARDVLLNATFFTTRAAPPPRASAPGNAPGYGYKEEPPRKDPGPPRDPFYDTDEFIRRMREERERFARDTFRQAFYGDPNAHAYDPKTGRYRAKETEGRYKPPPNFDPHAYARDFDGFDWRTASDPPPPAPPKWEPRPARIKYVSTYRAGAWQIEEAGRWRDVEGVGWVWDPNPRLRK